MYPESVAQALFEVGAVGYTPNEPRTFKSGIVSPVYVDNRRLPYHPRKWRIVLDGFRSLIGEHGITFDVVAGMETSGIPHASVLGYVMDLPSLYVRKQPKDYGEGRRVEGGDVQGQYVLLVEDMVSTGGSSLGAVEALRDEGALVEACVAITTYGFKDMQAAFADADVALHVLVPFETLIAVGQADGHLTDRAVEIVRDWHNDPMGWGARNGF